MSFWSGRRTFVTGGTGLAGSWLVKGLVAAGAEVVCLVRSATPQRVMARSPEVANSKWVIGDLRDQALLERALQESRIQTVMHLGAMAIVAYANKDPVSAFEPNIQGTWTLMEACRKTPGIEQIVVGSSDKVYGDNDQLPYTEETPLNGLHPYDASKACSDILARTYAKSFGMPVIVSRCGNFYGGGDENWNRIVPGTIRAYFKNERPLIRSDGLFVRDYFYVEDGAAAMMLLAEWLAKKPELRGHAFNFSNEIQVTVLEIVEKIGGLMGSKLQPQVMNEVSNEIRKQYLSAEKARGMLGWKPRFTLDEGLRRTVEWYVKYLKEQG